jgi:signal transduction histidine kinase
VQQSAVNAMVQNYEMNLFSAEGLTSSDVGGALMTPLWIEGKLILARQIAAGGGRYVQGCVLDWGAIKTALLSSIADVLPRADLQPVTSVADEGEPGLLATLPVRLIAGEGIGDRNAVEDASFDGVWESGSAAAVGGFWSPIRISLLVAWVCVLLAAVAVGALLAGVIRLSDRRAAFVSAVTHELRTPLTTFHMYTEMLAEGMVADPKQKREYLHTLRSEASRLSHLVENVLSYARLERGRSDGRIEEVPLGQLIGPIEPRLADRARQDGMQVVLEADEPVLATMVRANPSAVEQILLNLVDNAGKYAATASDKRIHLVVERTDGEIRIGVRDHGPGISPSASRRLFRTFSKSSHEAASSAPGVGLGLALSRRLARDMGGKLRLDASVGDGACFVLALPVAEAPRDA